MKIVFSIIVFNGDFVLKQVLESIYPHAHKILVAEGPVGYWQKQGFKTSTDDTNKILHEFPDPENKIIIEHGQFEEKTQQCWAWFKHVPEDTDYIWAVDSDEIFKQSDFRKVFKVLLREKPSSIGFQSNTFFGSFNHIIGGFERNHSFKRILKYQKGCIFSTHRPPSITLHNKALPGPNIKGKSLYRKTGVEMFHYSYLFGRGVHDKIQYYEASVIKKGQCIPNYFRDVWLSWVIGRNKVKRRIEKRYNGVHEFIPKVRGEAKTMLFTGQHPNIIKRDMPELIEKFNNQLKFYRKQFNI